jgi:hypothetical protein
MADAKSRARVQRLLSDSFHSDDLTGLFLFARDRCDGRRTVAEIGDFVAHHNERDKGIVSDSTREWVAIARFHWDLSATNGQLNSKRMPASTREFFRLAVRRIAEGTIRRVTRLSHREAVKRMKLIADALKHNRDGTWALPNQIEEEERKLIEYVVSTMVVKPAFSDADLFQDFVETLKSNGLISKSEIRENSERLKKLILLYAVAAMHKCVVKIGDENVIQLRAESDLANNEISVKAAVPVQSPAGIGEGRILLQSTIFRAHLDPSENCHPNLLATASWDFDLEVGHDEKLRILG